MDPIFIPEIIIYNNTNNPLQQEIYTRSEYLALRRLGIVKDFVEDKLVRKAPKEENFIVELYYPKNLYICRD